MLEKNYSCMDFDTLKDSDKFERYKYLSPLTNLISSKKDDCFVLQISGQYGSGKTFFVNLLSKYLSIQGYSTLYYNAWEHDYAQDAFVSFCTTFIHHFKTSPNTEGFKEATKNLIINNIPSMLMYCLKELSIKYTGIDFTKITETAVTFAEDVDKNSHLTQKMCNELLDIEFKRKNVICEFRNELSKLIADNTKEKPLVIFIDDLDRCKAEFTIRLLDYIKHLFNIRGITFILAVDDEQLKSTVQQFYGMQNANGYLRRIVDFDFKLPIGDYKNYIRSLIESYNLSDCTKRDYFINMLNSLGNMFDLSLRDFTQIFEQVHKVMHGYSYYENFPHMYFVAYIIDNYFYKYKHELALIETDDSKKYSDSQKLVRLFNRKFATNPCYINSLYYDSPVSRDIKNDCTMQDIMSNMEKIPNETNNTVLSRQGFPSNIICLNNDDPYRQKTVFERILSDMESIRKDG